jgi:NAD(P)-dependent dehydrogenase (short-subunit alcohol dehydrogenase family)
MKAQQPGRAHRQHRQRFGQDPAPDSLPYTVTKFGLQGMTHQLTMDGRKHNIVSSIIHLGAGSLDVTARNGDLAPIPPAALSPT